VQRNNFRQEPTMDTSWLEFVRSHPASTYAVSWTPASVAAFTTGWTIGIQPGSENRIADRIHSGEAPFSPDDLLQFGQRDARDDPGQYLRPDYWIYFRTDNIHTAEGPEPVCRQDYLVEAWQKMTASEGRPLIEVLSVHPDAVQPGSEVLIEARVTAPPDLVDGLEVLRPPVDLKPDGRSPLLEIDRNARGHGVIGWLRYNCASKSARGRIRVPGDLMPPEDKAHSFQFPLRVRYKDGRQFIVGAAAVTIENNLEERGIPDVAPEPQPSPAKLASALGQLPTASNGGRYVIFDLRPVSFFGG
jgi:hypothetical protein